MQRVAVFPGDDAAPEVVGPAVEVADAAGAEVDWVTGDATDLAAARELVDGADATLFGATSGRSALVLFYLRWGKQTYANVRPIRWLRGAASPLARPEGLDYVIVRENLEDLYLGLEGEVDALAPLGLVDRTRRPVHETGPGTWSLKVITVEGTRRVARAAFRLARRRRGRVTIGTKHNMLPRADGLFRSVALEVAAEFGDVEVESYLVDDLARRLVSDWRSLDVVLLPNLYGDILSDAAAGLVGGLGMAPSGCYGDDYAYFEPTHGTAPDLAGQGVINPTAQMLSMVMLLDHLGQGDAARRLDGAIQRVYERGQALTRDQGGTASTRAFTDAVREELARWA